MSTIPSRNIMARTLPAGKSSDARTPGQAWVPMVGQDAHGTGALVASGKRSALHPVLCSLYDAHMESGGGFAVIGHGVRLVRDTVAGKGAPCFVSATDAHAGRVYVFAAGSAERVRLACEREGVRVASASMESKGKTPGGTFTFAPDTDGSALLRALDALGGSGSGPLAYRADMGPAATLPAFDGMPQPEVTSDAPAAPDAPKAGKRGRPRKVEAVPVAAVTE